MHTQFLLTHPVWDVTNSACAFAATAWISTHTSRVGCDIRIKYRPMIFFISTHTSRVGCDYLILDVFYGDNISTHTSRVGCDDGWSVEVETITVISTHTSRVGCDLLIKDVLSGFRISTHTSRVGCDRLFIRRLGCVTNFYSHIPCGM